MMVLDAHFSADIVSMVIDGFDGDPENISNFFGRVPVFHEICHPDLLWCEIETGLGYPVEEGRDDLSHLRFENLQTSPLAMGQRALFHFFNIRKDGSFHIGEHIFFHFFSVILPLFKEHF